MTTQPQRHLILRWTAPKNLLTILLFVIIAAIVEFIVVTYSIPTLPTDPTAITIPTINVAISPLYHLLPITVIITLTASFTHLTSHTATLPPRLQRAKKPAPQTQKPTRLKPLRQFYRRLQRGARRIKNRILKASTVASLQRRISLAKAIIKSSTAITATFITLTILVTIAAYPRLVPTITASLFQTNTAFFNFVAATIKASESIANTITPLGIIATAIQNALNSAAPGFRNTLQGVASAITSGIVTLSPTEKYLIIQNAAAWTTAITTLLYSQYTKTRHYRR